VVFKHSKTRGRGENSYSVIAFDLKYEGGMVYGEGNSITNPCGGLFADNRGAFIATEQYP